MALPFPRAAHVDAQLGPPATDDPKGLVLAAPLWWPGVPQALP